jgi:hypothetical protein
LQYRLGGHTLRVHTLDLDRDRLDIHADLIGLVHQLNPRPAGSVAASVSPLGAFARGDGEDTTSMTAPRGSP